METNQLKIKDVALYLRKSRDESEGTEDVLAKHEARLIELAREKNYTIRQTYKEIGTSQHIDERKEMIRLLKDVENKLYDAVLVVDTDRLSRGDWSEYGRIERTFRLSNTLIISPDEIIDYNNDSQEIVTGVKHLVARAEYKQIKKRMYEGKKDGAKQGSWTNGTPPLPYVYNRNTKQLDIDPTELKTYNITKKLFIEDLKSPYKISVELNKIGLKTRRGGLWHENSVRRLLINEVHLGKVVFGKTTGNGHKNRINSTGVKAKDKSKWIVSQGTHIPVKTEEEHEKIMSLLGQRLLKPKEPRKAKKRKLSGLIFCGKCGHAMQFLEKSNGKILIKTCQYRDFFGNKCGNSALHEEYILVELDKQLIEYEIQLRSGKPSNEKNSSTLELAVKNKTEELEKLNKKLERFIEAVIDADDLEKPIMEKRKDEVKDQIRKLKEELSTLNSALAKENTEVTDEDRLSRIEKIKQQIDLSNQSDEDINKLLKTIVDRIEYKRDKEENKVEIKIQFI